MSKLFAQLAEVAAGAQRARTVQGVLETAGAGLWSAGLRLAVLQVTAGEAEARYLCDADGLLGLVERAVGRPLKGMTGVLDPRAPALQSLAQGAPIYIDDITPSALAFIERRGLDVDAAVVRKALFRAGVYRGVVLPVVVRGAPWGVIFVFSPELTVEDVAALGLFGAQLGSAIETADTIESLERRTRELAAVHSIATSSSSQGPEPLPNRLLEIAAQATDSDYGVIYVLTETRDALVRIGSYGYYDAALFERYARLPIDTHTGRTALMQQPTAIPVAELAADIGNDLASHGFRELCFAPLKLQGRPLGSVNLVRAEARPYKRDELRFAEILAGQIAIQLENARLNAEEKLRVAELRRSYERLEHTQEELVRHEKLAALGELAAAMAHELRNPLGAIFNALGSLKKISPKSSDAALFEAIIAEEADRVNRIVGDLLDFARPYNPELKATSIEAIVASALEATAQVGHDAGVSIETSFAPEVPDLFVDARILRQALINLLVNAIQATPRGGQVTVDVVLGGTSDVVHIDISDEGPGVAPEVSARIFEPFFTTKPTGTGLGLAVVKRIIEAHGGAVRLCDERGRGATFRVTLPACHTE